MIKIYDRGAVTPEALMSRRGAERNDAAAGSAQETVEKIRLGGDAALRELTLRFDGADIDRFRVTESELDAAWERTDGAFRAVLAEAAENIRAFHATQRRAEIRTERPGGIVLGQRFTPVDAVGIYVPGGTAAYPSSVLMNAIPASIAGCKRVAMATPPDRDGNIRPDILAAARVAGVTEIYKMGGAQAVAALAYGTESIPRVDKIVGPGNIYVAEAKRIVSGVVGIDMIAGPSEILIITDGGTRPEWLAADMLSQAEHDALAAAVLICLSRETAEAVAREIERQLAALPREAIARAAIERGGKILIASSLSEAAALSNAIAPEHLELSVEEPFELLRDITSAGSVFLGRYTPEPIGDYWAGPNHVLPTMGTARFSAPLSVDDFVKRSSYISYTPEALRRAAGPVALFAEREGLHAHARSVAIRMEEERA